jgi:hypothetical protein
MSDPNPVPPADNSVQANDNDAANNQGGANNAAPPNNAPPNNAPPNNAPPNNAPPNNAPPNNAPPNNAPPNNAPPNNAPPNNEAATVVVAVATPPLPPPPPPINKKTLGGRATAIFLVLFTALMIPLGLWQEISGWNFIAVMVLMILFMIVLGIRISSRPAGILINERNLISLARFQLVLWTVIILSAYFVAVLIRIHSHNLLHALDISLDKTLWGLLGISTASLVGSPLLQSTKKTQDPKPEEVVKAGSKLNEDPVAIATNSQGVLYSNPSINDAALSDMFEGDEVGNTAYIDVAKVQMFFFTIVAALGYGSQLFIWIKDNNNNAEALGSFPVVSAGLVAILGISHAGFLASKSTTHTPTESS